MHLLLALAGLTLGVSHWPVAPADAWSYRNLYLTADGTTRVAYVSESDRLPSSYAGSCTDLVVSGLIEIKYVAYRTYYKVSRVRFYQASTMKTSMTPTYLDWRISSSQVWEGEVKTTPSGPIAPGAWATLEAPMFYNRQIAYNGSMNLELSKPGAVCTYAWSITFFKK